MSVEVFVDRLKQAIKDEIGANHSEMDKGKERDEYMKLVGRNLALTKLAASIKELTKDLEFEDED